MSTTITSINKYVVENNITIDENEKVSLTLEDIEKMIDYLNQKKRRTRKRKVDGPKRPPSSYMLWLSENRQSILDEHFPKNEDDEHCDPETNNPLIGKSKVTAVAKKAGELWKAMEDEEKQQYVARSKEMKEKFCEEHGIEMKSTPKQKEFYDKNDFPDAPEGWCGYKKNTYLATTVKDPVTNKSIRSFKKFEDAS